MEEIKYVFGVSFLLDINDIPRVNEIPYELYNQIRVLRDFRERSEESNSLVS